VESHFKQFLGGSDLSFDFCIMSVASTIPNWSKTNLTGGPYVEWSWRVMASHGVLNTVPASTLKKENKTGHPGTIRL
jgi:hypothetical protein